MNRIVITCLALGLWVSASAQSASSEQSGSDNAAAAYRREMVKPQWESDGGYITLRGVPDGNYRVTVTVGNRKKAGVTTLRGESRRLFFENVPTAKGEFKELVFVINKRNTVIEGDRLVRIKPREQGKLNWDDNLTLEISGSAPQVEKIVVERVEGVPTVFLCGDSTTVDQDNEPWASWGQMAPRFFDERICFANYAESGESSNSFIAERRLEKIMTQIKPGDWLLVQFGHNDEKQKGPDKGAYLHFYKSLKAFVEAARSAGAHPVLLTPTQRRNFGPEGKLVPTHGEFPDAVKAVGREMNVPVIDLTAMTTDLFEALGVEGSKRALVHYPANTYPGQTQPLADNTHFNPYGAYQVAKCVIEGMKSQGLSLTEYLRSDYAGYDPASPDSFESFVWTPSKVFEAEKPDGN